MVTDPGSGSRRDTGRARRAATSRRARGPHGRRGTAGAASILLAALWAGARPAGAGDLEEALRSLVRASGLGAGDAAVVVLDERGEEVAVIAAGNPMKPASNVKLLTTAAALSVLGPEWRYDTRLVARGVISGGVLAGDLLVHSTGDPNISGRFSGGDPVALFRTWARRLRDREPWKLRAVEGDLVLDDTAFDSETFLAGWDRRHEGRWFAAEVSPLTLNDNCFDVLVVPAAPGAAATVRAVPQSDFVSVEGAPRTVARGGTGVLITRQVEEGTGRHRLVVSGTIRHDAGVWKDHVAVRDPALFFGHTLRHVFREEGIRIEGGVRRRRPEGSGAVEEEAAAAGGGGGASPGEPGPAVPTPFPGTLLVHHTSALLLDLPVINKRSQNLHAEILLKALGRAVEGEGSVAAGARVIRRFLSERGIATAALVVADGSGLSHRSRVTARILARTLDVMRREPHARHYLGSLSVAGEDGTLKRRFRRRPELQGQVLGKTGTIRGVSALSGYVRRGGRLWPFSILLGKLPGGLSGARELEERLVARIYEAMEPE